MQMGPEEMLREATIIAARLAAGRAARPIVFISDRPSLLTAPLVGVGEHLSSQGHTVSLVGDDGNLPYSGEALFREAKGTSQVRLLLVPEINELDLGTLAKLLDDLYQAAREGLPIGCLAAGSPATLKMMGDLREFAESLIQFKSARV